MLLTYLHILLLNYILIFLFKFQERVALSSNIGLWCRPWSMFSVVHAMALNSTVTIEDTCDANYRTHLILTYCFVSFSIIFNLFSHFCPDQFHYHYYYFWNYSIELQFKSNMWLFIYYAFCQFFFFLLAFSVAIVSFFALLRKEAYRQFFSHVCVRSNKAIPFQEWEKMTHIRKGYATYSTTRKNENIK